MMCNGRDTDGQPARPAHDLAATAATSDSTRFSHLRQVGQVRYRSAARQVTCLIQIAAHNSHLARIALALLTSTVAQLFNLFAHGVLKLPTTGFAGISSYEALVAVAINLCLASPIVETLMMVPVLAGLRRMSSSATVVVLTSAAVWAALHATVQLGWAIPTFWLFLIFTALFEATRRSHGVKHAIICTTEVHFFSNLFVVLGNLAFVQMFGPKGW